MNTVGQSGNTVVGHANIDINLNNTSRIPSGNYRLLVAIDEDDAVSETDEANNSQYITTLGNDLVYNSVATHGNDLVNNSATAIAESNGIVSLFVPTQPVFATDSQIFYFPTHQLVQKPTGLFAVCEIIQFHRFKTKCRTLICEFFKKEQICGYYKKKFNIKVAYLIQLTIFAVLKTKWI